MIQKKIRLCTVLLLSTGLTVLQAQETIPVTGGNASGGGGTVSYTIGQVVYTTNISKDGSVEQGVQQSYDISVIPTNEKFSGIYVACSAYPNPATDFLILKIEDKIKAQYIALLFDLNGRLLANNKITAIETLINMRDYVSATYILKVIQIQSAATQKEVKIFKIIKN